MEALQNHSDWAGVALALFVALALIAGYFLMAWFIRALTRRRVGFIEGPRSGHHLPDSVIEESLRDEHPAA